MRSCVCKADDWLTVTGTASCVDKVLPLASSDRQLCARCRDSQWARAEHIVKMADSQRMAAARNDIRSGGGRFEQQPINEVVAGSAWQGGRELVRAGVPRAWARSMLSIRAHLGLVITGWVEEM